jgi:type I restriction enzyme R subunit
VGYDVPIVQVMYLDKPLKEHTLLQAIARVNRIYDKQKDYGLIVDYCGITRYLQKALAIFEEEDIQGALEPAEKELEELKIRHQQAMSFFNDLQNKEDDTVIIEKFEPANVRDDFEYDFKMFSKAMDAVLPKKEAEPYNADFKYLSKKRMLIRNSYEPPGHSLKLDGKKVQGLIDEYVRALHIDDIMDQREVTYDNFLGYAAKFKTERARTALIKNKTRQIISELSPTNPGYYEKLRERLEKIIEHEEKRRKDDASYFNQLREVYKDAVNQDKERKKLGFSTQFEFAVFEELKSINNSGEALSKNITESIFDKIKEETSIVGWKTEKSSKKRMSVTIYDILTENKFAEDKINELIPKIIDLAERNL